MRRQPGAPRPSRPGAHSRSALTTLAEAPLRLGRADAVVGGHVAGEHAEHRRLAVAVLGPDRLGGRVGALPADERQAAAELDARGLDRHAAQRRHHPRGERVAVEGRLQLAIDPLEALLGEAEAGGVLVEALEHRPQRRLGLLAAEPRAASAHVKPERRAAAELGRRARAAVELAQAHPALGQEGLGARLVAIQGGAAPAALVDHVELHLGAGAHVVGEQRRGLEREGAQRLVKGTVAHRRGFASRVRDPAGSRATPAW